LASVFLWLALAGAPVAQGQAFKAENGLAEFRSSVPLHSFTGTSKVLVGRISLADSTVDFFLDLATLDTGIGKRDKDMRKTLNVDEHPFAEFFGRLETPLDPGVEGPQEVVAAGSFSINGQSRALEVTGTLTAVEGGLRLEAAWPLNLDDYDIVPPRLLVIKVDPIQQLAIDITLAPEGN
jgi:polyisoprenoid-binding protein YceI